MKLKPSGIKRPHLHGIRTNNRSRILQILRENDLVSRQELAERLELTPASLSRISKELIAQGICIEAPISRKGNHRGRPSVALQINAHGGYLIAVSISSYSRLISMIDITGQRHYKQEIPKDRLHSASLAIDFIGDYIETLIEEKGLNKNKIIGASFTLPGSINSRTGFLTKSVFLDWPEFPISAKLAERLGCPVYVENIGDALCLHYLDSSSPGKSKASIFLAHVSAGMGASIAIGGQIVRRLADEGWINDIVVPTDRDKGKAKVKLSEISSGRSIIERLIGTKKLVNHTGVEFNETLQFAITAANNGDKSIGDEFAKAGCALGASLVPLTIAYAPDTIVLAGPLLASQTYFEGVSEGYLTAAREMDIQPSRVVMSSATYIEAAESLALQEFFFSGAYAV